MWPDYVIEDNFLNDTHFQLLSNLTFTTEPDHWEVFKHQIRTNGSIEVSYKNSEVGLAFPSYFPLSLEIILDMHETYHKKMLGYLEMLCPDKIKHYQFSELNIVSNGKNFKFPIHNDSKDKLLSVVVYINPKKNKGTTLYSDRHGNNSKTVEWLQNRAFIFSRTDSTWHSYESDQIDRRLTLVYNLRGFSNQTVLV